MNARPGRAALFGDYSDAAILAKGRAAGRFAATAPAR